MKRHSLDLTSLVFALVFLVYASLWPLWRLEILDQDNLSWIPATAMILIGLLGVTLSIMRSRPERESRDSGVDSQDPWNDAQMFDDSETTAVVDESR